MPKTDRPVSVPSFALSRIDQHDLGVLVKEMRYQGYSYKDVKVELDKRLPKGESIGVTSVFNWCKKNGLAYDVSGKAPDDTVNTYNKQCEALRTIDEAIALISVLIEEQKKNLNKGLDIDYTVLDKLVVNLERCVSRQQSISKSILEIQATIYNYSTVSSIIDTVLTAVKERDLQLYNEIAKTLAENPVMREAIKRIAPIKEKNVKSKRTRKGLV